MNTGAAAASQNATSVRTYSAVMADLVVLGKLRIVAMEAITILAGFLLAAEAGWQPSVLIAALVGTGLVAASASALNQVLERRLDARMVRTRDRPLPAGRMSVLAAVVFATATGTAGVSILAIGAPLAATMLAIVCWLLYVVAYTPLKTRTTLNTAVGALSGAIPIAIGWLAAGGAWSSTLLGLFGVLVLWQYPHFMAIAWRCRDDYLAAGYMMSTTADTSGRRAGWLAIVGSVLLIPVVLLPIESAASVWGGSLYAIAGVGLTGVYLSASFAFASDRNDTTSRRLLRVSLLYLPLWLVSLAFLAL